MKTLAVIPARYASTRFPGKPLATLGGKPVLQWVWERTCAVATIDGTMVATDDERILNAVETFGGRAMMTSSRHRSGTDRCGEVLQVLSRQGEEYDLVINVQGDEPFVQANQLTALQACFSDNDTQIATLKTRIRSTEELLSANNVKVVCDGQGNAIYFSRQPIPFLRGVESGMWLERQPYYKHVGLYAFRADTLRQLVRLTPSPLEQSESLEQLRWIENGYTLRVVETEAANIGIDTPEDLAAAERSLQTINKQTIYPL